MDVVAVSYVLPLIQEQVLETSDYNEQIYHAIADYFSDLHSTKRFAIAYEGNPYSKNSRRSAKHTGKNIPLKKCAI